MIKLIEKAGIHEFDNILYRQTIEKISKIISIPCEQLDKIPNTIGNYKKYSFNNLHLTWLDQLDIYIDNYSKTFDAGALTGTSAIDNGLFKKTDTHIELGSIYILNNNTEKILPVIFHEIMHLFDTIYYKNQWYNDETYYLENREKYDINNYDLTTNIDQCSFQDIHNIITESMYFSNLFESHALMENINFEIYDYVNNYHKHFLFDNNNKIIMKSSKILYDIYILLQLIKKIYNLPQEKKNNYFNNFKQELTKAYNFKNINRILLYIISNLNKIWKHSKTLFNYYYNLNSILKQIRNLDESAKNDLMHSYSPDAFKRRHFIKD